MAQFDQAARYLIKRDPLAFFRWVAPGVLLRWRFRGFIDTSTVAFPGEPERVCDTVAEFVRINETQRRVLLDAESQTEPHPDMLERLGEYAYRLRRELRFGRDKRRKYMVLSVLLNLTGKGQRDELDMTVEELGGAGAKIRVVLLTLREQRAAETLAQIERGELDRPVLPWVALMQGAGQPGIINEWKRLAEKEPDGRWRSDLGALALIFADLAGRKPIWQAELREWNVKESQVVKEWKKEAEIHTTQANLLRLLHRRFSGNVPVDLENAITATTNAVTLGQWFDAAIDAPSLAAFRQGIGR